MFRILRMLFRLMKTSWTEESPPAIQLRTIAIGIWIGYASLILLTLSCVLLAFATYTSLYTMAFSPAAAAAITGIAILALTGIVIGGLWYYIDTKTSVPHEQKNVAFQGVAAAFLEGLLSPSPRNEKREQEVRKEPICDTEDTIYKVSV